MAIINIKQEECLPTWNAHIRCMEPWKPALTCSHRRAKKDKSWWAISVLPSVASARGSLDQFSRLNHEECQRC